MTALLLLKADFKNIRRDPMLMMSMMAPLYITLLLLYGFPSLNIFLAEKLSFRIDAYYSFACVFLLHLIPMMFGMVYGFILLDERDEGLITYFSVTPLGKRGYLKMRLLAPMLYSCATILLFIWITRYDDGLIWWKHIPLVLITAAQAPIMFLFLAGFAADKVAGVAIAKGFGILLLAVPIDYFIVSNWTYLAGVSPLFWTARGYLAQDITAVGLYIIAAAVLHTLYLIFLYKKFAQFEN